MVLEDKDAITASGFVWIHWLIANLERTSVQENESLTATDYVQGQILGQVCWVNLILQKPLLWGYGTT